MGISKLYLTRIDHPNLSQCSRDPNALSTINYHREHLYRHAQSESEVSECSSAELSEPCELSDWLEQVSVVLPCFFAFADAPLFHFAGTLEDDLQNVKTNRKYYQGTNVTNPESEEHRFVSCKTANHYPPWTKFIYFIYLFIYLFFVIYLSFYLFLLIWTFRSFFFHLNSTSPASAIGNPSAASRLILLVMSPSFLGLASRKGKNIARSTSTMKRARPIFMNLLCSASFQVKVHLKSEQFICHNGVYSLTITTYNLCRVECLKMVLNGYCHVVFDLCHFKKLKDISWALWLII